MEKIDYSIQYRRWHDGTLNGLINEAKIYDRWIGSLITEHSPNAKVLDYGCGFGGLVYYLKNHFENIIGVDASTEQIEVGLKYELPLSVVPIEKFKSWCTDNAGNFDIIFLFDVLEHIPSGEQIAFMRSLTGLLSENGVMYIKVPNANSLLASRWRYIDWTHSSSFTEASLDFVCLNSGLNSIKYFRDDSSVFPRYWYIPRWKMRFFYFKWIFRKIWKLYLKSELGSQANTITVGYNLFMRAKKIK